VIFKCSKNFELQYIKFQAELLKHSNKKYLKIPIYNDTPDESTRWYYYEKKRLSGFLYADKELLDFKSDKDSMTIICKSGTYYWHKKSDIEEVIFPDVICIGFSEIILNTTCRVTSVSYLPRKGIRKLKL
jgi:hypothetical protein